MVTSFKSRGLNGKYFGSTWQLIDVSWCIPRITAWTNVPIDEVGPWLSNCVLQRSGDCESCANTQAKPQDTAVELPQAILEPVPAAQTLHTSPSRGHGRRMREESINDKCVKSDDDGWAADDENA
jgi:hypothetical protein